MNNQIILYYINTYFIISVPSSVQNATVMVVGDMINITWSPPSITDGMILQYIVLRINTSGRSYYRVSGNQNYLELIYFNNALVFVSAINQYGQSSFEQAKSSGKETIYIFTMNALVDLITCTILFTA